MLGTLKDQIDAKMAMMRGALNICDAIAVDYRGRLPLDEQGVPHITTGDQYPSDLDAGRIRSLANAARHLYERSQNMVALLIESLPDLHGALPKDKLQWDGRVVELLERLEVWYQSMKYIQNQLLQMNVELLLPAKHRRLIPLLGDL